MGQEENITTLYKNGSNWPIARLHENVKDALWKSVCASFGAKGLNTAGINEMKDPCSISCSVILADRRGSNGTVKCFLYCLNSVSQFQGLFSGFILCLCFQFCFCFIWWGFFNLSCIHYDRYESIFVLRHIWHISYK